MTRPLRSVLVANRGEIVGRICRTAAARGMRTVAVYAPTDAASPHVAVADEARAVTSYLDAASLVAAALAAGVDAVHPGYGFVSEDPDFARAVEAAGLVWVGPPPAAIEAMGDKIAAKATVAAAGVPVVPGAGAPGMGDDELAAAAIAVGLPVLVKPAAGGGGKGMRRVDAPGDLPGAIAAARREARGAFGDDTLLVERFVPRPRHIEIQVFTDAHGGAVHLAERECSLQRRHQKIVEEAPSPFLTPALRAAMCDSALAAARACGYVGAGTVEFIVSGDDPSAYYFMEMNTRLQVEHPVTEAVTGIDLVDWQFAVAAGESLPSAQEEIVLHGHAVEARVYAEDPARGWLPAAGTVARARLATPAEGIRVDATLEDGMVVGTRYDPMLAKVVAWAPDRRLALARLRRALAETVVLGVTTNVGHLVALLDDPDVVAGNLDTELVERTRAAYAAVPAELAAQAAVAAACRVAPGAGGPAPADPWDLADGWRPGAPAERVVVLEGPDGPVEVGLTGPLHAGSARVGDGPARAVSACLEGDRLDVELDGARLRWETARTGEEVWVGRAGRAWRFVLATAAGARRRGGGAADGRVTSPMPGTVVAVHVHPGDAVTTGQALVAVEAMKMEHAVVAPLGGTVEAVHVAVGQTVALDEVLAEVAGEEAR